MFRTISKLVGIFIKDSNTICKDFSGETLPIYDIVKIFLFSTLLITGSENHGKTKIFFVDCVKFENRLIPNLYGTIIASVLVIIFLALLKFIFNRLFIGIKTAYLLCKYFLKLENINRFLRKLNKILLLTTTSLIFPIPSLPSKIHFSHFYGFIIPLQSLPFPITKTVL